MKRYRIGDFARELGVTPDFLKYCEKQGYLTPHTEANGYRYYDFVSSAPIIEYMKLRNQGSTAREINEALHESSFGGAIARMESRREELTRHIAFEQALLRFYDEVAQLRDSFREGEPLWQVRRTEGFYFLPHSREQEFIAEDAVREKVSVWNRYLPIVASTKRLPRDAQGRLLADGEGVYWGFSVEEGFAREVGLPTQPPALYVPPRRCLELFLIRDLREHSTQYVELAETIMARIGMRSAGDVYCRVVAKLWENGVRNEYSVMLIPVES